MPGIYCLLPLVAPVRLARPAAFEDPIGLGVFLKPAKITMVFTGRLFARGPFGAGVP